ncbi:MAG: hypothetical protein PVG89_17075, partial [Gammaproteobacteria bacterium]
MASAVVQVDIRSSETISEFRSSAAFVLSVSDCTDLTAVDVAAGSFIANIPVSEATRVASDATACEFRFTGSGSGYLNPQATLHFRDNTSQQYAEALQVETTRPTVALQGVSLAAVDNQQKLIVQVSVSEDTDLRFTSFSVLGLRASDLRASGGVVDKARQTAFAATNGNVKVYPRSDDQQTFDLVIPVTNTLDAEAISHDGLVLLDVTAVDASGNLGVFSKIAFTGSDVNETAQSLQANPTSIIFTNLLESVSIVPLV